MDTITVKPLQVERLTRYVLRDAHEMLRIVTLQRYTRELAANGHSLAASLLESYTSALVSCNLERINYARRNLSSGFIGWETQMFKLAFENVFDHRQFINKRDPDRTEQIANDLITILGEHLQPIPNMHVAVYQSIRSENNGLYKRLGFDMRWWHTGCINHVCGTTHCRAGIAVMLHPLGTDIEEVFGSWLTGAVIYKKSTDMIPDFFCTTTEAFDDIKRCAGE